MFDWVLNTPVWYLVQKYNSGQASVEKNGDQIQCDKEFKRKETNFW